MKTTLLKLITATVLGTVLTMFTLVLFALALTDPLEKYGALDAGNTVQVTHQT